MYKNYACNNKYKNLLLNTLIIIILQITVKTIGMWKATPLFYTIVELYMKIHTKRRHKKAL